MQHMGECKTNLQAKRAFQRCEKLHPNATAFMSSNLPKFNGKTNILGKIIFNATEFPNIFAMIERSNQELHHRL